MELNLINDYIGWALALLLLIPAYMFGRRNKQRPELRSAVSFEALGRLDHVFGPKVRISFDGREIENVGRTHLAIWNARGDNISKSQILSTDPLRVQLPEGCEVLQARVVSQSRPAIALRVVENGDRAELSFDFLDRGDGGIVEILHTGPHHGRLAGVLTGVDMRDSVSASLHSSARAAVRSQIWGRVKYLNFWGRRRIVYSIAFAALGVAGSVIAVLSSISLLRKPSFADPADFDLTELSGQYEFASRVREIGQVGIELVLPPIALGVLSLLLLGMMIRRIIWMTSAAVPRNVVLNDVEPFDDGVPDAPVPSRS